MFRNREISLDQSFVNNTADLRAKISARLTRAENYRRKILTETEIARSVSYLSESSLFVYSREHFITARVGGRVVNSSIIARACASGRAKTQVLSFCAR